MSPFLRRRSRISGHEHPARHRITGTAGGFLPVIAAASALTLAYGLRVCGGDLPATALAEMRSDEFQVREQAQAGLLAWARQRPEPAKEALYLAARGHADPEVRERCLAVLRDLVTDDYLKEGEGYIGIRMQDETALVPGENKPRSVIRVVDVVEGSAALKAGVKANDLICGLNDMAWRDEAASTPFSTRIRKLKPGSRVTLKLLRDGEVMHLRVTLGRRPLIADNPFLDQRQVDLEAAEQAAREAYFRRWLDLRKSRQ